MEELKQKYVKLSSLFSLMLFQSYATTLQLSKKEQMALYEFGRGIKEIMPKPYFDQLFGYIAQQPERAELLVFMSDTYSKILEMAQKQLSRVKGELDLLVEAEDVKELGMDDFYNKLLSGFYYSADKLDKMLAHYTEQEAFEKCEQIISIKRKYYKE